MASPTSALGFQNFFSTTLTSGINATDVSIPLDTVPNANQGFLVIDPDSSANREVIFYTSKTGSTVECASAADGRGQDDTTAGAHSSGVTVICASVAGYFEALQSGAALSDGAVDSEKLSATIACKAYRNTAFNVTGGSSDEKIILDAEVYDTGGDWDTTNGRFTAPVTGWYQVNAQINLGNVDSTGIVVCAIYVNGAPYTYFSSFSSGSTQEVTANGSDLVYVTAGQYIEMYADCSSTEAVQTGSTSTFMSIYFVGA